MKKLKVIFYDEAIAVGGSLMVLSHLFREIDRDRVEPMLVTAVAGELGGLFSQRDIIWAKTPRLNYVTRMRWSQNVRHPILRRVVGYLHTIAQAVINLRSLMALSLLILKVRPDVMHINNGFFPFVVAWAFRIPVVLHFHGIQHRGSGFRAWFVRQSKAFISISKVVEDSALGAGYPVERLHLIVNPAPSPYSGLTRRQVRAAYGLGPEHVVVAHVARLVRWKGQIEFLQALNRADLRGTNVIVLIVGDCGEGFGGGYEERLKEYVEREGLEAQVKFVGYVADPLPVMHASDVVVHSSIEPEPFGLVVTEAMAAGAAVIASRLGGPAEIVDHGVDGYLVNPSNTDEFAVFLRRLVCDSEERERFTKAALVKVSTIYSAKLFAGRAERLYRGLIEAKQ